MYCCLETPIGVGIFSKGTVKRIEIYTKKQSEKKHESVRKRKELGI